LSLKVGAETEAAADGAASIALSLRLSRHLYRRRWVWFWLAVFIAIVMSLGASQLRVGHGYRQFIDRDDAELRVSDAVAREVAAGRDTLTLIYRPASRQVFESTSMLQLAKLADLVSRLDHVSSPQSLVTSHKLVRLTDPSAGGARADAYRVVPLIYPDGLFDDTGLARLRRDVATMPTVNGRLVARDGSSASVILPIDLGATAEERAERLAGLRAAVLRIETDLRGLREGESLVLAGPPLFEFAVERILSRDLKTLAPVALGVFFALLLFLFRSFRLTYVVLSIVVAACMTTIGALCWAGMHMTILAFSGLILVATLSIAEALHVITTATLARLDGMEADAAMIHSLDSNLWAIVTTSATTVIGEAVLICSASPAVRDMGVVMMVGALLALFFTVSFVPALASLQKQPRRGWISAMGGPFDRLSRFCAGHPTLVLLAFGAIATAILPGLWSLRSHDTMSGWFAEGTEFRQGLNLLDENYLALGAVDVITKVETADRDAVAAWPAPGEALDRQIDFDKRLAAIPGVRSAITPTSALEAFEAQSARQNTSLQLTTEVANESPSTMPPGLSTLEKAHLSTPTQPGKDAWLTRTIDAGNAGNAQLLQVTQSARSLAADLGGRETLAGGLPVVFAALGQRNMENTVLGTLVTVAAITACLALALRSLSGALLSMFPNVLPIALVFGFWGWVSGDVNLAATTVLSIALGIVVDDTTHIMMKHRRLVAKGHDPAEASRLTIVQAGPPIVVTTIILACGFVILGFSNFALTSQQSLMIAASVCVAVVFDLTVTPVMLSLVGRRAGSPLSGNKTCVQQNSP
jgi:predicted RND superfamily exporter protein